MPCQHGSESRGQSVGSVKRPPSKLLSNCPPHSARFDGSRVIAASRHGPGHFARRPRKPADRRAFVCSRSQFFARPLFCLARFVFRRRPSLHLPCHGVPRSADLREFVSRRPRAAQSRAAPWTRNRPNCRSSLHFSRYRGCFLPISPPCRLIFYRVLQPSEIRYTTSVVVFL